MKEFLTNIYTGMVVIIVSVALLAVIIAVLKLIVYLFPVGYPYIFGALFLLLYLI